MSADPLTDLSRLCVHTITTKGWELEEAVERYAEAGVSGITVWRQWLEGRDPVEAGDRIRAGALRRAPVTQNKSRENDEEEERWRAKC